MNRNTTRGFSANEKDIERLLKENSDWKENLSYISEEIQFLLRFLNADVFQRNILELDEKLQLYRDELENIRTENLDLIKSTHNHRYDIEGIRECEDISCEVFYHEEHIKLGEQIREFSEKFCKFKLEVFSYTGNHLRRSGTIP